MRCQECQRCACATCGDEICVTIRCNECEEGNFPSRVCDKWVKEDEDESD